VLTLLSSAPLLIHYTVFRESTVECLLVVLCIQLQFTYIFSSPHVHNAYTNNVLTVNG